MHAHPIFAKSYRGIGWVPISTCIGCGPSEGARHLAPSKWANCFVLLPMSMLAHLAAINSCLAGAPTRILLLFLGHLSLRSVYLAKPLLCDEAATASVAVTTAALILSLIHI